jgi:simple sugar transport system permease protein
MTDKNNNQDNKFLKHLKKNWAKYSVGIVLIVAILYFYDRDPKGTQAVLASMVRHSTPLILGALCGLIGERSGIINIGIEGQMLISAFAAFMTTAYTGNIIFGVVLGIMTGMFMGYLLAIMSIALKLDQIIGGTVLNILALGITSYFYQVGLSMGQKILPIPLGKLADLPLVGRVLFNNPPITYATFILVFVVHYILFHTKWGLRTRAVGEHPRAADTVGVDVFKVRYVNTIVAGGVAGLAGSFLSLEAVGSFERAMTNGRGFVALAVMIFGRWTPFGAWGAALLFGFASAMQTQINFSGVLDIPYQFISMLPYLLTIVVLAGFVGRSRAPAASGVPYEKEG